MSGLSACLFDLDGVIVDTAKYHFIAWRQIARELGFEFTEKDNERLKGVSRTRSLEILLEVGGLGLDTATKVALAEKKNAVYLSYVMKMTPAEILPGAERFLTECRSAGYKTALATASRNAAVIVELLKIASLFDVVVDGNRVTHTKPDPEVFLTCASELGIPPASCAVFEDAEAGIEAAHAGCMLAIGIGDPAVLKKADLVVPGLGELSLEELRAVWAEKNKNTVAKP
ncbi:beta-phosphoglucomutase [Rhizomicrobium electricum]|uniref:Beta-phosphoglucomutase n=1 Tax=Rhizomicrobium electricum TaxID=480070 RepID=A0ABN1EYA0_9PROT|nr:beta-phosphoglucomutase [Rhizomicrobium electricum]NIJ49850.1 beta-phosphoglucomutase [Rhizomicrobium electricum]